MHDHGHEDHDLGRGFSPLITYNAVRVHPIVGSGRDRRVFSIVLVRGRRPGVSYSVTF